MSTLRATTIKHESSSSNNIVLNSNGTITANNSIKPASVMVQGSGNHSTTSFADMFSCTITPTQSTSHMLVIITGSVGGEDGNNNNNTGNGTMRLLRGTTQLGDSITGGATGGDMGYERFDQANIETNSDDAHAYYVAARASLMSGRYDEAIDLTLNAIAKGFKTAEAYSSLGIAYLKTDTLRLASAAIQKATQLKPKSAYLKDVLFEHRNHHASQIKEDGEFFGMLFVSPKTLRKFRSKNG